jgi:DNA polymerase III subunit gamma/tau
MPANSPEDELLAPAVVPPRTESGDYVVVARRYRPQAFAELIGQEHVGRGLIGAIQSHRVGHAYLFTGARGVGKTSAARILAKALNCTTGPTPTPCNECDICRSVSSGDDVDVLEIDGASNRGIDEIRQLRQNVNIRPSRSRFKVYIIDEVHMLTREAFNALLKTLEEPPEHVKFIFCTTEPEKIPITILSRCQRYDFAGIQAGQIVKRLEQIVAAEGVEAEPEALAILARRAAGSMRDSQSLLEQLLAVGSRRVTVADVHAMLGTAGGERLAGLVSHLVERNSAAALADLDQALAEGVDVGQLLDQLLGYFRDVMAAAIGCPADSFLHAAPSEQAGIVASAQRLGLETVLAMMQILDHTLSRLRFSTHGRTLAELALVRIAHLADLDCLADLVADLRNGSATAGAAPPTSLPAMAKKKAELRPGLAADPNRASFEPALVNQPHFSSRNSGSDAGDIAHAAVADAASVGSPGSALASSAKFLLENAQQIWDQAVSTVEDMTADHAKAAAEVAIRAPNQLAVIFGAKYNFSKTFCERPDRAAKLEEAVAAVAGRRIRLLFELAHEPPDVGDGGAKRGVSARQRKAEIEAEIRRRPLVQRAVELFNASVDVLEKPACSKDLET